jgi:predicted ATPase
VKIAFFGASGTGKTTLAKEVSARLGIPLNPVGSRSTAEAMGYQTPYEVHAAGRSEEFQIQLSKSKQRWESNRESFVTDRTGADEWAYASEHSPQLTNKVSYEKDFKIWVGTLDYGNRLVNITSRYDLIFFTPIDVFHDVGEDPARLKDLDYHRRSESRMLGFMDRFGFSYKVLDTPKVDERVDIVMAAADSFELDRLTSDEYWSEA